MDLRAFASVAANGNSQQIFAALNTLVQQEVGAIICSCSTFDAATGKAKRIYSNQPDAYPVSGLKDVTANDWTRLVLGEGKIFIANAPDEIARVFPDHQLIGSLGCGSAVNMPIKLSGSFLGTVNILNRANYYAPERVERFQRLEIAAIVAFCSLR